MKSMQKNVLLATVFVTGAAVLIIEVSAVRILAPYFGSGLHVFSSVLTVVLGALSLGYYFGGKLADRLPTHQPLYAIIALGGVAVLAMLLMALRVLPLGGDALSVTLGPLIFSLLMFFVPAFLLGIDSPYVIKLLASSTPEEEMGKVVGATFFWSTLGSITGSLLTGFVLVPVFGITTTILVTALTLVALGLLGSFLLSKLVTDRHHTILELVKQQYVLLVVIITLTLILFGSIRSSAPAAHLRGATLFVTDGLYSRLLVYEGAYRGEPIRALLQDANNSSAAYIDSYDLPFGYTQFAEFYRELKPDTERFLMMGAGSYTIPRTLVARDADIQVTVTELEPQLWELAQTYFDLSDTARIDNQIVDSRVYLRRSTTTYDVIFADAFGSDHSIPFHLATHEFFTEVKKDLAPDGIFMMNYIGALESDTPSLTGSLVRTLQSVFPNLKMYAFNKAKPESPQNIMFIARNGAAPIDLTGLTVIPTNGEERTVNDLEISLDRFSLRDELLLTDNHAPVEYLMLSQL